MHQFKCRIISLAFAVARFTALDAQTVTERTAWRVAFDSVGVEGTFVLRKVGSTNVGGHNVSRASRAFIPASTFKIRNLLIALETGIVSNERARFSFTWASSCAQRRGCLAWRPSAA